jgi:hypothetical protein
MTTDSSRNPNGVVGIRRSITSILISVGSLVLSLVVVSLFVFSYPSASSQFGYLISADKLGAPSVVSNNSNNNTQKDGQYLSNGGTPSENVKQELLIKNPVNVQELGSNETLSIIKDPLMKNENSISDETPNDSLSNSKEASTEGELLKNDQGQDLISQSLILFYPIYVECSV